MPATYSINIGQIIESTRKTDIFNVLQDIPDNTQKLISPRDIRDAFLSAWANSSFKITTPYNLSNSEYIGIDSGNPNNRDIKKKILLGKRSYGNLDIMNNVLLNNSNADIFIYNTKPDNVSQNSTKMAFLSGTNSNLHINAPYIESYATGSVLNLNINNPSLFGGAINLFSQTGRVSLNGIVFPTVAETSASASNGRILKYSGTYPNGVLRWDDATLTITNIGNISSPTDIYGSDVNINGYSLEFIDDDLVPESIGGIVQGSSFSSGSFNSQNWPLSEVIREILYPYIEPVLQLSLVNTQTGTTYAEVGTTPSLSFSYSITTYARDNNELISDFLLNVSPIFYGSTFSDIPGSTTQSVYSYATYSNSSTTKYFTLNVSTDTITPLSSLRAGFPYGYSFSATSSVEFISPFLISFESFSFSFSGGSASNGLRNLLLSSNSTKLVTPYPGASNSVNIQSTGSGYLYFILPYSYPNITQIKDPNGFIIHDINSLTYSAFTYSSGSITPTSPLNYYGTYRMYRTIYKCNYVGLGNFEFIF